MSTSGSRPYTKEYLANRSISELLVFVEREETKWPKHMYKPDALSSLRSVKSVLLNSKYGFARPPSPSIVDVGTNETSFGLSSRSKSMPHSEGGASNSSNMEETEIKVFVHDLRHNGTGLAGSTYISVSTTLRDDTFDTRDVKVADLFDAIQKSDVHIGGAGKLMLRDPEEVDEEFWIMLVRFSHANPPFYSQRYEHLELPQDHRMRLRVISDDATVSSSAIQSKGKRRASSVSGSSSASHRSETGGGMSDADSGSDAGSAKEFPLKRARKRARREARRRNDDIKWLEGQISKRENYSAFLKTRNARSMTNDAAIIYWAFISSTITEYLDTNAQSQTVVTLSMIQDALGIKESTRRAAVKATNFLQLHGDKADVKARVAGDESGCVVLLNDLNELQKKYKTVKV